MPAGEDGGRGHHALAEGPRGVSRDLGHVCKMRREKERKERKGEERGEKREREGGGAKEEEKKPKISIENTNHQNPEERKTKQLDEKSKDLKKRHNYETELMSLVRKALLTELILN